MPQMKEQEKSPEKELNKMEASNLPDTEFKNMVVEENKSSKISDICHSNIFSNVSTLARETKQK